MTVGTLRNAKLIIDQKAIFNNVRNAVQNTDSGTDLFVVVKANGYGHGAIQVAKAAEKAGAKGFCVALLEEALELRQAGFTEPILVLGITEPTFAPSACEHQISLTVSSTEWLTTAASILATQSLKTKLHIHLAMDTGMGRIGFQTPAELQQAIAILNQHATLLDLEGLFTHFATADSQNDSYFNYQYENYQKMMAVVDQRPKYVHVANTATSLWHRVCGANMIRYGIATYGLNPSGRTITKTPYPLHPAMRFEAGLTYVKRVAKGRSIGYGATYQASEDEWIGTVPIGYADGFPRKMQGFSVLVDGQYCPVVGRVCMDQFMIKLPKAYPIDTTVTIIGKSGNREITVDDLAEQLGTINYEVVCGFSERLQRKYV
ncbi:alanine racemase [Lentilactobacillus raoultii]|uniref:Alanine racemase n=1 Tax=Lentilactobacillus raoultii TaxID=1987503 RepID=A0ABW3PDT7_9LACO|nr:alanine racemase [Lentilactobacillus raoultii]